MQGGAPEVRQVGGKARLALGAAKGRRGIYWVAALCALSPDTTHQLSARSHRARQGSRNSIRLYPKPSPIALHNI